MRTLHVLSERIHSIISTEMSVAELQAQLQQLNEDIVGTASINM